MIAPSETFQAAGWTDVHTHRVLDGVTPITVTLGGTMLTRGVDYTFAYGSDTIHFLNPLGVTGEVVVSYGGSASAFSRVSSLAAARITSTSASPASQGTARRSRRT